MKKIIISLSIFFAFIGTIYAYNYFSSDIEFTPNDGSWQVDNVGDAINDLFDKTEVHEECFTGFTAVSTRPSPWNGVRGTPIVSESGNLISIDIPGGSAQASAYVVIDNIEKYKFIFIEAYGTASNFDFVMAKDMTSDYTYEKQANLKTYYNNQDHPFSTTTFIDVRGFSGQYHVGVAGTHLVDVKFTMRGVY